MVPKKPSCSGFTEELLLLAAEIAIGLVQNICSEMMLFWLRLITGLEFLVNSASEKFKSIKRLIILSRFALGFLNLDDEAASGNQGLKDMVLALKWVKENIENFGGDSNNVTIFGISSGGSAVHYLTLSPLAQGLVWTFFL